MAEETAMTSIKARIAALNMDQVGRVPATPRAPSYNQAIMATQQRPPPPLPPRRPSAETGRQSTNNPSLQSNALAPARVIGNQPISTEESVHPSPPQLDSNGDAPSQRPALPQRPSRSSTEQVPALPPRRPSEPSNKRRESIESVSSAASGQSSVSGMSTRTSISASSGTPGNTGQVNKVRAPLYDPASLPLVPEKRSKVAQQARVPLKATFSSPNVPRVGARDAPVSPPPSDDNTPPSSFRKRSEKQGVPPQTPPRRSALSFALNESTETPPPVPLNRPGQHISEILPPVPRASRPNIAPPNNSKPIPTPQPALASCLKCRDFSAPDTHASRFPRASIPSTDIHWLAHNLTAPFPSTTDKARTIFTWLHHNIAYDTTAFFAGTVEPSTPASTLASGLAVCEGYAGLFAALAGAAGLEVIVVGGHGKGYSYAAPKAGAPIPPFTGNHAWNAARIDGGEWKLVDPCWGAGAVESKDRPYVKRFAPEFFTMDNVEFGLRHFPADRAQFFRADGRAMGWEEYVLADAGEEKLTVYLGCGSEHGINEQSFVPQGKRIKVADAAQPAMVRFQFGKVCKHWDGEKQGKGKLYLLVLKVGGRDGRKEEYLVLQHDGFFWWVDVPRGELGAPGQKVSLFAVTSIDGKDGRGLTAREYAAKKGRVGMGFGGIAAWELV